MLFPVGTVPVYNVTVSGQDFPLLHTPSPALVIPCLLLVAILPGVRGGLPDDE